MPRKLDPIFAAIAAHRLAYDEFSAEAAYLAPKRHRAKFATEWQDAKATYEAATDVLVQSEIATVAGAQAFAAYLGDLQAYGGGKHFPCCYSIEVWHLSDAMARIGEALGKLRPGRSAALRPAPAMQALPAWVAH
jgi:hypothetical protein